MFDVFDVTPLHSQPTPKRSGRVFCQVLRPLRSSGQLAENANVGKPRFHCVPFGLANVPLRFGVLVASFRSVQLGRLPPPSFQLRVVLRSPSLRFGELNTTLRCLHRGDFGKDKAY